MSSEAPSRNPASSSGPTDNSKRQRTAEPSNKPPGTSSPPAKVKTPSEAAKDVWSAYVETLHPNLQPFFSAILTDLMRAFAAHEWKRLKHKEMEHDVDYIPSSCKIGLTLNAVDEVKKSEDFKTLNVELDTAIVECQKTLAKFAIKAHALTVDALHERFKKAFCTALPAIARGFMAEHDIQEYDPHQAVIDCIACNRDEMIAPLNTSISAFLKAYKAANELSTLPEPTMNTFIGHLVPEIRAINGEAPNAENETTQPPMNDSRSREAPPPSGRTPAPAHTNGNIGGSGVAPARNPASSVGFRSAQSVLRDHDPSTGTPIVYLTGPAAATTASRGSVLAASTGRLLEGLENEPFTFTANPYNTNNTTPGVWGHGNNRNSAAPNPVSGARGNTTNAALAALQGGTEETKTGDDEDMGISEDEQREITMMAGGHSLIHTLLLKFVKGAIYEPVRIFINQIKVSEDAKRIKKAVKPVQLATAADRIAEVVNSGRPVAPPTLTGLIDNRVDDATTKLAREVQSLKAQLANQLKQPKGRGSGNNSNKGRQPATANNRRNQQSQTRNQNAQRRTGGRHNGTSNGSGGSNNSNKKRPSNSKSNGNGRGLKTNRRK